MSAASVVSLVPSVTETLLAVGVTPLACTRFCEQPALPHVGGTKNPDISAVAALAPDVVVVNDEENRIEDVEELRALGLAVHDMSPRTVGDVGPAVAALAERVGVAVPEPFGRWTEWLAAQPAPGKRMLVFVPIWRRPWMTMSADTYGSSLLGLLGWDNVFAASETRYPETTLEEAAGRRPDAVLLPTEPYSFRPAHFDEVAAAIPAAAVSAVDGQDLFW
ncbi:MAG: helical backbone metal receptor, partial [Acidimicrobiia bacterium]